MAAAEVKVKLQGYTGCNDGSRKWNKPLRVRCWIELWNQLISFTLVFKVKTSSYITESGRWTSAIQMFDRFSGLINIAALERFALSGNNISPCIYRGASHQGERRQIGFVLLTALFSWTVSQLWKPLRGLPFRRGLALKNLVMLHLHLAVRIVKLCERSLSISGL